MNINQAVKRFKRNIKGQVNYENVANYITEKGYTIILFDDNTEEIRIYGLDKIANEHIAFTYKDNVNLIFIRRSCIEYQKLQLLLHEIAHIELNHFDFHASNSDEKEYQANRFAQLAMEEKHISLSTVLLSVILSASLIFNIRLLNTENKGKATDEAVAVSSHIDSNNNINVDDFVENVDNNTKVYYVTKTGSKYHTASCGYAQNSYPVDEETAKRFYSPCSRCNP